MIGYPKIETLYNRNPEDMKHVIFGDLRDDAFGLVDRWLVTEKIHGTNVRVGLTWEQGEPRVRFGGRTDDAQMPTFLLDALVDLFPAALVAAAFDEGTEAVLFGEGYGPRIQKGGGDYAVKPSFRLFDVAVLATDMMGDPVKTWWLNWDNVVDVADKLAVKTVPVIGVGTFTTVDAINLVRGPSKVAMEEGPLTTLKQQEGIVCRTDPLLFTRRGDRLIWKLKGDDLA